MVHVDHGVGIYRGLKQLEVGGGRSDYLLIEYQGNDRLYLPIDRVKLVQKFRGADGAHPPIDRLGGTSWKRTKSRVKNSLMAMAKDLLDIYASRKLLQGHPFSSPDHYYREFEATFPYEETPDQLAAIEDVMRDMNDPKPMDRLICGDVGYGKTEVAARAAFKVIEDGYQVAVLVPTTVLAEQHAATFRDRFASFPVTVACLNRFRTTAEQKAIVRDLAAGRLLDGPGAVVHRPGAVGARLRFLDIDRDLVGVRRLLQDHRQVHEPVQVEVRRDGGRLPRQPEVVDRVENEARKVELDDNEAAAQVPVPEGEHDRPNTYTIVKKVALRDGQVCTNPACRRRIGLHAHHIRFRMNGGRTRPENEVLNDVLGEQQ